ncbi:bifunctional DNA-formamidopyrimidine glycosylase/DNA-(apurinic or apyrimidinic site) lyase [Afifella sp. H1R]|uniref:bifunctional DNA-formamidopyrimidine glycosylase/DNA-(apurinic or apyrimidinic site) lyase n=1 Tax=Afifella sp. H1R TaxID=2908841 RepID=UPI001F25CF57|nr:bifunctional DNA-formamidopyrimidine glycosylase/DNA-(apurinic or apyrimidinic site) lyase [Afifella sp. H1R]MCF1505004.1 bifunctional DNA-formamidopyrimidine glycosylase/DNA-(apurinic or apyrimidinic site) lyase [Afifella sp. H1R]
MPELPEVETIRRGLAPVLEGRSIEKVELRRPDLRFPLPPGFAAALEGRRIDHVGRRAKYLLVETDIEAGGPILIMHLGMTGSFRFEGSLNLTPAEGRYFDNKKKTIHDHVVFHLDGDLDLVFNDARRFGFMALGDAGHLEEHPLFAHLGLEPTGNALSAALLATKFAGRKAPLKAVLMDQRVIAGLGNIYVCEALWRARLSPRRAAGTLVRQDGEPSARLTRLVEAVRAVIADAVAAGGSSLRDYVQADGSVGRFQESFAVYDREDFPCPRPTCSGVVSRIVQSGRSTFFCPVCQR